MNLIANLPIEQSSILLFAFGCVLVACGIFFSFKPILPSSIFTFGGLLVSHFSGLMTFDSNTLWFWGVSSVFVVMLYMLLPREVSRSGRGQWYLALGALAGAMIGVVLGKMIWLTVATAVGVALGALMFARTSNARDMADDQKKLFNYFLAKGLPLTINFCMLGIFLAQLVIKTN